VAAASADVVVGAVTGVVLVIYLANYFFYLIFVLKYREMQWSKRKTRIILSVVCALAFMVLYVIGAATIAELFPGTFLTRNIELSRYSLPPLILAPVFGPMMLSIWLKLGLYGNFSTAAVLYRIGMTLVPPILFYSLIAYLLLGRLKWFRKKIDEGLLPEPPPPPEFY